jgi:hypothetical protein
MVIFQYKTGGWSFGLHPSIKGNRASHLAQRCSRSKRSSFPGGPQRGQTPRRIAACHPAVRSAQFRP